METNLHYVRQLAPDCLDEITRRYRILEAISYLAPCGRRTLVEELALTERTIRNEVERLQIQNLIEVSNLGMMITNEGIVLLENLKDAISITTEWTAKEKQVAELLGVKKVIISRGDFANGTCGRVDFARVATRYFMEIVTKNSCVAMTGGTTIENFVTALPQMDKKMVGMVVPARGSIGRHMELQADTLVMSMATRLHGEYCALHLPDNLSETALEELQKQPEVKDTLAEIAHVDILLLAIGDGLEMAKKRLLDEETQKFLFDKNVVAETCGYYFDANGSVVYKTQSVSIEFQKIKEVPYVLVMAGGEKKAKSLLAVSQSIPHGVFIIDEVLAQKIIEMK
ncbi:MAG: sugar-binding domain-containing protein [Bacillota bacterium]